MMEKRNVAEDQRTPAEELARKDEHWDKQAAEAFEFKLVIPAPPVLPGNK